MKRRPHFKKLTKDLIAAVDSAAGNAEALKSLISEIGLRKKAADRLAPALAKAERMLLKAQKRNSDNNSVRSSLKSSLAKGRIEEKNTHATSSGDLSSGGNESRTKSDLRPQQSLIRVSVKRWILARLLGGEATEFSLEGGTFRIRHKGYTQSIEVASVESFEVEKRFFSCALTIRNSVSNDAKKTFTGLARSETDKLRTLILELIFGAQLRKSMSEFEALISFPGYLNNAKVVGWKAKYETALRAAAQINKLSNLPKSEIENACHFSRNWQDEVKHKNDLFVAKEAIAWRPFFDRLEANPLTDRQVEGILREEDHTLIVAGAGTGKTSTVVGKIGYLIERRIAKPSEILALAFARKAAEEMRERVEERTGHKVEIRTFHSLGRQIYKDARGEEPCIADVASDQRAMHALIAALVSEMMKDNEVKKRILNFISFHRYPAKYLEDFDRNQDYLVYLRKHEPRTLRGEIVKSFEELLISDWMTLNGIRYEYEQPYEIKTASSTRRQYRPDFYLPKYGIYLEHFGVGKNGETALHIDKDRYAEGMKWKRDLHKKHQTTLIETYSWERQEGVIFDNLEAKLKSAGVSIEPMSDGQIKELLNQREVGGKLVALLRDFLAVFKEGQWTFNEVQDRLANLQVSDQRRSNLFIEIFEKFYLRYEAYLERRQEIDFADLIGLATTFLSEGQTKISFRRIIVDEYQDISRGRFRLLRQLMATSSDCRIMCVGDDWQSIFGFTGSDIEMTTNFESLFGYSSRVDLDRTFRFTKPILDVSAEFVQANPTQLKKTISAREAKLGKSIEIVFSKKLGEVDLAEVFQKIDSERPSRVRWSVQLLGRYNFSEPENWRDIAAKYKMLDIEFLTVHRSKGLEANVVVVLGLVGGRFGFPGEIPDDPLMHLILPCSDDFPKAEERRVFYVALTRAKDKVILLTNTSNPSKFVEEVMNHPDVYFDREGYAASHRYPCKVCGVGHLELAFPNRKNGYAWRCSMYPYCDGAAQTCQECQGAPALEGTPTATCMNPGCRSGAEVRRR